MNHPTRRRFLSTAASTAAALAYPNILRAAETPPSERITLGFIGLGRMGRSHIVNNFCKRSDVHGLAVCDVDTTRRDWSKTELDKLNAKQAGRGSSNDVATYNNYRDLLARDDIDAVVIATPDHWHAIIAIEALRAGKDVYCEKPLTHTPLEALALMAEVKNQKRVLQTGSMQRSYMLEFRVACELVTNGVIGDVKRVEVSFGGPPKACDLPEEKMEPGLDWNRWIGPAEMRPYHSDLCPRGVKDVSPAWRKYREFGGGGVMDFGAHHVDIARWGTGLDDEMPVEVRLDHKKQRHVGAQLVFANGTTITHTRNEASIDFFGETGNVRVGRRFFQLVRGDKKEFISRNQAKQVIERYLSGPDVKPLYRCTDHHKDFIDAVHKRTRPICHEDIGGGTAMSCHLINIAYRYGQNLQWDAARNTFAHGGGNPAWLGRTHYRPPHLLPT